MWCTWFAFYGQKSSILLESDIRDMVDSKQNSQSESPIFMWYAKFYLFTRKLWEKNFLGFSYLFK